MWHEIVVINYAANIQLSPIFYNFSLDIFKKLAF